MLFDTKEEALEFLKYHVPTNKQVDAYDVVDTNFQELLDYTWDVIPSGPGKVIAIRALNDARMKFNSAIANNGK